MTAPLAPQDTQIHIKGELVSKPYIDITLHLMRTFGVSVSHDNYRVFHIQGHQTYIAPGDYLVEGDASSASYFLAAAAIIVLLAILLTMNAFAIWLRNRYQRRW